MKSLEPVKDRFEKFVAYGNGCWLWSGARDKANYGVFWLSQERRAEKASRVSYEIYVGPIPSRLFVLHSCDNPPCVRPSHLFLGTHQDNMDDRKRKGHYQGLRGSKAPGALLTEDQVIEIRKSHPATGTTELARRYAVHQTTISKIVHRKQWRYL